MLCSFGSQSFTCTKGKGAMSMMSFHNSRAAMASTCCSVTCRCASCASFCTSGGGRSLVVERTLLACCKQRLGAEKDTHVQRCVLFCSSFVAERCMLAADGRISVHDERKSDMVMLRNQSCNSVRVPQQHHEAC